MQQSEGILFKASDGKRSEKKKIYKCFDRITTITHLASVPGRVLSGIVRLGLRPGRTVSQHAGGRRFA